MTPSAASPASSMNFWLATPWLLISWAVMPRLFPADDDLGILGLDLGKLGCHVGILGRELLLVHYLDAGLPKLLAKLFGTALAERVVAVANDSRPLGALLLEVFDNALYGQHIGLGAGKDPLLDRVGDLGRGRARKQRYFGLLATIDNRQRRAAHRRPHDGAHLVLLDEFLGGQHRLGFLGLVILDDDLEGATVDAACLVDGILDHFGRELLRLTQWGSGPCHRKDGAHLDRFAGRLRHGHLTHFWRSPRHLLGLWLGAAASYHQRHRQPNDT